MQTSIKALFRMTLSKPFISSVTLSSQSLWWPFLGQIENSHSSQNLNFLQITKKDVSVPPFAKSTNKVPSTCCLTRLANSVTTRLTTHLFSSTWPMPFTEWTLSTNTFEASLSPSTWTNDRNPSSLISIKRPMLGFKRQLSSTTLSSKTKLDQVYLYIFGPLRRSKSTPWAQQIRNFCKRKTRIRICKQSGSSGQPNNGHRPYIRTTNSSSTISIATYWSTTMAPSGSTVQGVVPMSPHSKPCICLSNIGNR